MRADLTRQIWDSAPQGRVGAIDDDKWRKKNQALENLSQQKKNVRFGEKYPIPENRIFRKLLVFFSPEPAFI